MVHTAKFYAVIDRDIKYYIEDKFNQPINMIGEIVKKNIGNKINGVKINFISRHGVANLYMTIDFIKLLNKSNITENDYKEIEGKVQEYINCIFDNVSNRIELKMIRIDYRIDIVIEKEKRIALLNMYKKALDKSCHKKKYSEYDSSVYFNNKSIQVVVYDKEEERNAKNQPIQEYEKDVLRLEVRLMNRHLNMKKRTKGFEKDLKEYLNDNIFKEYINKQALPIFYRGEHKNIIEVDKILNEVKLKESYKGELREFLVNISKRGMTKTLLMENGTGERIYSRYRYNKYIKSLVDININPILIPRDLRIGTIDNMFFTA